MVGAGVDARGVRLQGVTYKSPDAGNVEIPVGDPLTSPTSSFYAGDYGVAVGPLELTSYPDTTARVGGLHFDSGGVLDRWFSSDGSDSSTSSDTWFSALPPLAIGAGAATHNSGEDGGGGSELVTRRDVLKGVAATGVVAGGMSSPASATTENLMKATFTLHENPGGVRVRIYDRGENVLPSGSVYHIAVDGLPYTSVPVDRSSHGDIPPSLAGDVSVSTRSPFTASVRAALGGKHIRYADIQLPQDVADLPEGERVVVTSHEMIVNHVHKSSANNTILKINGNSIPHYDEASMGSIGWYAVRDNAVVYQAGSSPPDGSTASLSLYAGKSRELSDDARRAV